MWYPLTKIVESTKIAQGFFFAMALSKKCFKLLALPLLAMFQYLQQWAGKILVCVHKCDFSTFLFLPVSILDYVVQTAFAKKDVLV